MSKPVYPLKQVLEVKQRRVEDAEKVVKEKRQALKIEEDKLAEREADRNKVKKHYQEKLIQFREQLDGGTTSPKIQQSKAYLKVVDEKLKVEEKRVKEQQELVKTAQKNLEQALEVLRVKRQEVDKLHMHQKDWEKTMRKEMEVVEAREQDEMGFLIHLSNQRKTG
jgi:hypothetical protein